MESHVCAVIALLVVSAIILAVAAWVFRRGGERCRFMPGDPAPPKLRSAIYMVGADLDCIARLAKELEALGGEAGVRLAPEEGAAAGAIQCLAGAGPAVAEIRFSVGRLRLTIGAMAPTYLNVLALYRGLRDGDRAFGAAAADLEAAGARMAALSSGAALSLPAQRELRAVGARLGRLSTCLRALCRSIHHLGAALDLE